MRKVKPGDPLRIPADTFNALIDAADAHRRAAVSLSGPDAGSGFSPGIPVTVRNTSGADRDRFAILEITGMALTPADNPRQFQSRPVFTLGLPKPDSTKLVILQEPIVAGRAGHGLISGVSAVRIDMTDAAHAFAKPIDGDPTKLVSSAAGPFRILYAESGTGTKWAAVYFPVSSGATGNVRIVKVTGGAGTMYIGTPVDGGDPSPITFWLANYFDGNARIYGTDDIVFVGLVKDPEGDYWVGILSPWAVYL